MIKKIIIFGTEDGRVFDNEHDAVKHEDETKFSEFYLKMREACGAPDGWTGKEFQTFCKIVYNHRREVSAVLGDLVCMEIIKMPLGKKEE